MIEDEIDASVGMTRKWDAREAGRDVARNTIKNLKTPPSFVILFSTIHYKDHGGFEEFLKGVWDVIPKGTPLVGGTVVGFVNNFGCYTRGASALAVSSPNMDISIGYGLNTKRNPKKAVNQCVGMIEKNLENSSYKNKFLLNLVAGPELMAVPGQGYKKYIDSGFMSKFIKIAFGMSQYLFQKGVAREDEIFENIVEKYPSYQMILGTTFDNYKGISHYQFFNNKILKNSLVCIGISTNLSLDVGSTHGMKKTDVTLNITKLSKNGHIIHKINNKPAVPELKRLLEWPDDFFDEKTMLNKILYYPLSLKRKGREVPTVMPYILKNSIMTSCKVDGGEASVLTVSGKNIIEGMKNNLNTFNKIESEFVLCSSCMTILQTLGYKMNILQNEMVYRFNDTPFLMFYCAGEGSYSIKDDINYANMSFNTAVFGKS